MSEPVLYSVVINGKVRRAVRCSCGQVHAITAGGAEVRCQCGLRHAVEVEVRREDGRLVKRAIIARKGGPTK